MKHSNCYCLLSVNFSSLVSSYLLCDGSALKSGFYVGGWCAGEFLLWSTHPLWQMHPREIGWCPGAFTCQRVCMRPVALETKVPQTDVLNERWRGKQKATILCICPVFSHSSFTYSLLIACFSKQMPQRSSWATDNDCALLIVYEMRSAISSEVMSVLPQHRHGLGRKSWEDLCFTSVIVLGVFFSFNHLFIYVFFTLTQIIISEGLEMAHQSTGEKPRVYFPGKTWNGCHLALFTLYRVIFGYTPL